MTCIFHQVVPFMENYTKGSDKGGAVDAADEVWHERV